MHTLTQLDLAMFDIEINGAPATAEALLPDWNEHDRLGVVIAEPLGGVGSSHLIQLAITLYYATHERRRGHLAVYPEIYAFHINGGHGSHAAFDFWPARREIIVDADPRSALASINDHAITRLAVPDRPESASSHDLDIFSFKELDAARDLVTSSFAYSADGRTARSDVSIRGNDRRTEINPSNVLNPDRVLATISAMDGARRPLKEQDPDFAVWMRLRTADLTASDITAASAWRDAVVVDGKATETYRRITVEEALLRL
jgi:hypothetical protein